MKHDARVSSSLTLDAIRGLTGERTPCYAVDLEVFRSRIDLLRNVLPPASDLYYSAKANPMPELLSTAAHAGCGIEVASPGELAAALATGIEPTRVLVVGPAKSSEFLSQAVEAAVGTVVLESAAEVPRLETAACGAGASQVAAAVRLNVPGAKGSLRMSGHQFGMDAAESEECLRRLSATTRVRFVGFHAYLASQLLAAEDIVHNAAIALARIDELTARANVRPSLIDLGGGFGIPYGEADAELDLDLLAKGLLEVTRERHHDVRYAFESGRFLAGPAAALLCRVVEVKVVEGRRFVLLDGGTNSSGIFGGTGAMKLPRLTTLRNGAVVDGGPPSHLCGPLCTPMDRLASSVASNAEPGDIIVWWNMGAYGRTAAPTAFLSFEPPREVVIDRVGSRADVTGASSVVGD